MSDRPTSPDIPLALLALDFHSGGALTVRAAELARITRRTKTFRFCWQD